MHKNMGWQIRTAFGMGKIVGDVGVELEIEGDNLPGDTPGWVVKPEGSLRGGLEYVTRTPSSLESLKKSLQNLTKTFAPPCQLRLSNRGSTHVHVNVQSLTFRELYGFVLLLTMLEPVILRLCGPKRNGNLFCLPSYETGDLKTLFSNTSYHLMRLSEGDRFYTDYWYRRGKYSCFNTDPVSHLGSVEGRCFPVSVDPDEIVKYASWMVNARELAVSWPDPTYESLFTHVTDYPETICRSVFGDIPFSELSTACSPASIHDLLSLGVQTAHEAYWSIYDSFHWKEGTDRKKGKKPIRPVEFEEDA